jgi:hypothetical protein
MVMARRTESVAVTRDEGISVADSTATAAAVTAHRAVVTVTVRTRVGLGSAGGGEDPGQEREHEDLVHRGGVRRLEEPAHGVRALLVAADHLDHAPGDHDGADEQGDVEEDEPGPYGQAHAGGDAR